MAKIDTSNIDKKRVISDIEKKYGTGETMNKSMTFFILKYFIIGIMSLLGLTIIAGLIMSLKGSIEYSALLEPIKICVNLFGAAFMALVGYFIGKKSE